jgi:hypothetical protein
VGAHSEVDPIVASFSGGAVGIIMTQPQLLEGFKYESQVEDIGKEGSRGMLPNLHH